MMKLPITLLVLAAIGQAVHSKLPPANKTTDPTKTSKRDLYDGNYGLRNGLSYGTKFGATPGIEYVDESKVSLSDKSQEHQIFGGRAPHISKISDVLTGQGGPFEVEVANHLYSPVSVYHARLSSPTTFDVLSETQPGYPEYKFYKQNQQHGLNAQNPQNNEPKPGYRPEYTREESKLLHLETAFPRLEPSYSTSAPLRQDIFFQQFPNPNSHPYPQFRYQHVEQIPFQYLDSGIQPVQYVQKSVVNLGLVQSESDNEKSQDNQPTERPKEQVSTEAPNQVQEYNAQLQGIASYANYFESQPYAPSQQYLPVPQSDHLQPQDEYQFTQESTPQPEGQLIQQEDNQYQQYQQHLQSEQESPRADIESQQVVHIRQTTPRADQEHHTTQEVQESLATQPELETLPTGRPDQPQTISTFKPFSEYSTTPKLLELEDPTTTVVPYTTHKPLSIMPLVPLRPLPGSRRLPFPRPFSNTQPTTVSQTRLPFRRFPKLPTRQPTSPSPSSTFSSLSTITTTPQPEPTVILTTQSLPNTVAVSRTPIIRIRHKPSYNQFQSTTPQPTRPDVTTLESLSQPTSTIQPSTTFEPETQSVVQTVKTQQPDNQALGPEYLPASELPPQSKPGVIYHLQSQPQFPPSPSQSDHELYSHPFQIQPSPHPKLQVYPQPSPPPQSYPQPLLIQPSARTYLESFLPPGQIQFYQTPVFNLRPQYQPLSTPLPPLQSAELPQPNPTQSQLQPRPDAQESTKLKPLTLKSKVLKTDETYLTPGAIASPIQTILQPQLYSQSHELFIRPDFHRLAVPTFPSVQYFGKYAEAIFGNYHH